MGAEIMISHSIFNDVLGPIMAGPSSSHSAGCARIGRMTRLLWGKDIKKAVVVYDSDGRPLTCEPRVYIKSEINEITIDIPKLKEEKNCMN